MTRRDAANANVERRLVDDSLHLTRATEKGRVSAVGERRDNNARSPWPPVSCPRARPLDNESVKPSWLQAKARGPRTLRLLACASNTKSGIVGLSRSGGDKDEAKARPANAHPQSHLDSQTAERDRTNDMERRAGLTGGQDPLAGAIGRRETAVQPTWSSGRRCHWGRTTRRGRDNLGWNLGASIGTDRADRQARMLGCPGIGWSRPCHRSARAPGQHLAPVVAR